MLDLEGASPSHTIDLGVDNQMILRLVGVARQGECYGFASVFINTRTLSSSVWCWFRWHGVWTAKKVIEIPAETCPRSLMPQALEHLGAVPPLVTDIKLSRNDRFLYVSCWGTGELLQYDVVNPLHPRLTGTVRIGGMVQRFPHPMRADIDGGPQSLQISDDGLRVYVTNSASGTLDRQFYPGKGEGWLVRLDSLPHGGLTLDDQFFVAFADGLPQEILLSDQPVVAVR
jgi:selenium-binding protein 1